MWIRFISGIIGVVLGTFLSSEGKAHELRVGKRRIDETHHWVIIGIRAQPRIGSTDLDFKALGFVGHEMDHVDPKFLLELDSTGVSIVRSFELQAYQEDLVNDTRIRPHLPRVLIDVRKSRREAWKHSFVNHGFSFGKLLGTLPGVISAVSEVGEKNNESFKKTQAYYLLELIHKSLPSYDSSQSDEPPFQELRTILSPDPDQPYLADPILKRLGQALLTRFNPKSNWAGLNFKKTSDGDSYLQWRNTRLGERFRNKAYVQRRADELGLELASVGRDFGILFIPLSHPMMTQNHTRRSGSYIPEFMGMAWKDERPSQILSFVKRPSSSQETPQVPPQINASTQASILVPWSLISFVNSQGPVELFDFIRPVTFSKQLNLLNQRNFHFEISGSIIPLSNFVSSGIKKIVESHKYHHRNMRYLDRRESFGSVLALAETQFDTFLLPSRMELDGVLLNQLRETLQSLGLAYDHPLLASDASDGFQQVSQLLNELTAILISQMENNSRSSHSIEKQNRTRSTKAAYHLYLQNILGVQTPISPAPLQTPEPLAPPPIHSHPVSPPALPLPSNLLQEDNNENDRQPLILFLVDGMRPDRFKEAALSGWMPHLKELFYDRGTELKSFVSRSLTIPSWATSLTGWEPDFHGIRSNTPTSRLKHKTVHNYEDPRPELFDKRYRFKNRAFVHLEEDQIGDANGRIWLPDYYDKNQTVFNYMPISNKPLVNTFGFFRKLFQNRSDLINGTNFSASTLDSVSAESIAKAIRKDKKNQLRLVMIWFSAVDTASHYNNFLLPSAYRTIDQGIGQVLEAAKNHPTLKNATTFLISDHGHSGGFKAFNTDEIQTPSSNNGLRGFQGAVASKLGTLFQDTALLSNTGFNLTRFFAGDYTAYSPYSFVIGSSHSTAPEFDYGMLGEFCLHPFRFTYPNRSGSVTALVDFSGDNLAQVYIKQPSNAPSKASWPPLTYHQLTQFPGKDGQMINFPKDLLNIRLPNLAVSDRQLAKQIMDLSGQHPVKLFAMPLRGTQIRDYFDQLIENPQHERSSRDPILILAKPREPSSTPYEPSPFDSAPHHDADTFLKAIILTRSIEPGKETFKYIVLEDFNQDSEGLVSASVSLDPEKDPLQYLGSVVAPRESFAYWRSDEEWLALAKTHPMPTALFALPRILTLSSRYTEAESAPISLQIKQLRQSEIPDFLLLSHRGYAFHPGSPLESDHGGFSYEEVRNSFFVSSLMSDRFQQHLELSDLILNRDILATVLEYSGWFESSGSSPLWPRSRRTPEFPITQGTSRKALIEEANWLRH